MFANILVPFNERSPAEQAVGMAAALARASDGDVELMHARADDGRPADVICRRVSEVNADLVVMTSHGRTGLSRAWLGSVADEVVRNATVPVLVLRANDERYDAEAATPFTRILVAIDGSPESDAILGPAVAMAQCTSAALILTRVVHPIPILIFDPVLPAMPTSIVDEDGTAQLVTQVRTELTAFAEYLERQSGLRVEVEVMMSSDAAEALMQVAVTARADLIAMTTHGRGASRLVIGSVTDKVLRGSHLPLLLYHPVGVRAPVSAPVGALPVGGRVGYQASPL
jgi:nucleotide-binding universal stress UspA family protein